MGYTTTARGTLCCDACGRSAEDGHPARRHKCPYGYCPSTILCAACKASHKDAWKAAHKNCKALSEAFDAEEKRRSDLIAAGRFVRTAAMSNKAGSVDVLFKSCDREFIAVMAAETYHAKPFDVQTIEDFEAVGDVVRTTRTNFDFS